VRTTVLAIALIAGSLVAPVLAQNIPAGEAAIQLRAKDLIGREVYSSDGAAIGEIEDLVLDPDTGRVVSAVLQVRQGMGFDGRYLALPVEHLRLGARQQRLPADLTREQFRTLPGIRYRD